MKVPHYVTDGLSVLDALHAEHVEGNVDETYPRTSNSGGQPIETPVFALRAYCWCEGAREARPLTSSADASDSLCDGRVLPNGIRVAERDGHFFEDHTHGCPPNFEHFESGLQLSWYKHADRGQDINHVPTALQWASVLRQCIDQMLVLPPAYRVMVTGSREWGSALREGVGLAMDWATRPNVQRDVMRDALRAARERAGDRHIVLVHGAARGADQLAALLAGNSTNAHPEPWPALWRRAPEGCFEDNPRVTTTTGRDLPPYFRDEALYMSVHGERGGDYDKRAGFARNEAMLASGVDEVLAFFADGAANRGTQGAVGAARRLGIPVTEYRA